MTRQSITLAQKNDEWLKDQVKNEEFSSKSEAVNYLIKQAREQEAYYDYVRMKIKKGKWLGRKKERRRNAGRNKEQT